MGKKELEEQQLVTNYILDVLRDKVSNLQRTPTETVRAGQLLHLRAKITGILESKGLDIEDLESEEFGGNGLDAVVKALHPTPAVCGLPKESALGFIRENEHYDREFYTGFLGELNLNTEKHRSQNRRNRENQAYRFVAKSTTLFVNLRCMKLTEGTAGIYVGGGITEDSELVMEWEETVAKSQTMLSILKR